MGSGLAPSPIPAATLSWLLDPWNPSARYLTLTEILGEPEDAPAVRESRAAIALAPPARDIFVAQYPQGYWMHPGIGYSPRYRATIWQMLILAQLGVARCTETDRAVEHLFEANQRRDGGFRASKEPGDAPVGLHASLLWALETMGYGERVEVRAAWSWLFERVAAHGLEDRPFSETAPSWGPVKVLWAANAACRCRRDEQIEELARLAAHALLEKPPSSGASDPRWYELTFPLTESADLLQWLRVLVTAGYEKHPALDFARDWLASKRQSRATWSLERVPGKMWGDFGEVGEANKWITIRALSVSASKRGVHQSL